MLQDTGYGVRSCGLQFVPTTRWHLTRDDAAKSELHCRK